MNPFGTSNDTKPQPAQFQIKTPVFEGPLDLLLTLIEKRKLLVSDIALAAVTDDYILHVRRFEQFPISESASFILIASTLLLIKSKSLLPTLPLSEDEQGNIADLQDRLKLYQRIKELSVHVKERFGAEVIFARLESKSVAPVFSPEADITPVGMLAALKEVLKNLPQKHILPKALVRKVMSLEEMIENLADRIKNNLKMSFKEFSKMGKVDKVNVIVSFLAMLELVKQGIISVTQESRFQDIEMQTEHVGVPNYN